VGTVAAIGVGCVAVSLVGNATNAAGDGSCGVGIFGGAGVGCIAVSALGSAANSAGSGSCGVIDLGVGVGCIAIDSTPDVPPPPSSLPHRFTPYLLPIWMLFT
jgi:hypothetical protein